MSNSDAFEHVHRWRDSHTHRAVTVARRQLDALAADLDAMLRARRVDDLAPGSGLAGRSVRGGEANGPDPTGNTALRHDPPAERWARWDLALAELTRAAAELINLRDGTLHHPTPTGLCRGGMCPTGSNAAPGKAGRCYACDKFWYKDASNPNERREREEPGQTPRGIGLNRDAVA